MCPETPLLTQAISLLYSQAQFLLVNLRRSRVVNPLSSQVISLQVIRVRSKCLPSIQPTRQPSSLPTRKPSSQPLGHPLRNLAFVLLSSHHLVLFCSLLRNRPPRPSNNQQCSLLHNQADIHLVSHLPVHLDKLPMFLPRNHRPSHLGVLQDTRYLSLQLNQAFTKQKTLKNSVYLSQRSADQDIKQSALCSAQ